MILSAIVNLSVPDGRAREPADRWRPRIVVRLHVYSTAALAATLRLRWLLLYGCAGWLAGPRQRTRADPAPAVAVRPAAAVTAAAGMVCRKAAVLAVAAAVRPDRANDQDLAADRDPATRPDGQHPARWLSGTRAPSDLDRQPQVPQLA